MKREGAKKDNCPLVHNTYTISCIFPKFFLPLQKLKTFDKTNHFSKFMGGQKRVKLYATLIYKGVDSSERYEFGDAVGDNREYYRLKLQAMDTTLAFLTSIIF